MDSPTTNTNNSRDEISSVPDGPTRSIRPKRKLKSRSPSGCNASAEESHSITYRSSPPSAKSRRRSRSPASILSTASDDTSLPKPTNATSSAMNTYQANVVTEVDFRRPASLLDLESRARQRKRHLLWMQTVKEDSQPTGMPLHVCGLPVPERRVGVCGNCGNGGDEETILLCDGVGCQKEYHMKCCTPPLYDIPQGSFYCFDCSTKGTTAQLEDYLEQHQDERENYYMDTKEKNVLDFVDTLLTKDVQNEQPKFSVASEPPKEYPRSELDWIYQNDPMTLLGKPVRMYSPVGNTYHNGRIVDIRSCPTNADTECRIRFPAGSDYRKSSHTSWIRLEEHSLAVCTQLVWAKFGERRWFRARFWSRTARELVPVMHQLLRFDGPLRTANQPLDPSMPVEPPDWGLIENILGTGMYDYVELKKRTAETAPSNYKLSRSGREVELMKALTSSELEAQKRVKQWRKLPLVNPMHPAAIQCQEENDLGTLEFQVRPIQYIQPSPLVPQGIDRSYLLEKVSRHLQIAPSKDVATTLLCQMVEHVPGAIQRMTRRQEAVMIAQKFKGESSPETSIDDGTSDNRVESDLSSSNS